MTPTNDCILNNIEEQLTLLGRGDDTEFLRAIHNDGTSVKIKDKINETTLPRLKALNAEGKNIYYVVNGQGDCDKDINQGYAVFIEHDDLDKEKQIRLWEDLKLPEPTFQIDTGNKSIHSYWVFKNPIDIADWIPLQADLITLTGADKANKNQSRIMRLVGFKHTKTGKPAKFVSRCGTKYSYDDLRAVVPKQKVKGKSFDKSKRDKPNYSAGVLEAIRKFPKSYQKQIKNGAAKGQQNPWAFKIAAHLAAKFQMGLVNESVCMEVIRIFFSNCEQNPDDPFTEKHVETVWNSAKSKQRNALEASGIRLTNKERIQVLRNYYSERIRYNELSRKLEVDKQPVRKIEHLWMDIAEEMDIDISKDKAIDIMQRIGFDNSYNPVVDYLQDCHNRYKNGQFKKFSEDLYLSTIEDLIQAYFHIGGTDSYHLSASKKIFISCVARMMQPGCKADLCLILKSTKQGMYKSTALNLLGGKYFLDMQSDPTSKDGIIQMHESWIIELSEVEKVTRTKEAFDTKSTLTCQVDKVRAPYQREAENLPRKFIIFGTTNEDSLFIDPTGNRRYVVLTINKRIDIELIRQTRDYFWALAYEAYQSGEQWHLTDAEVIQQADLNKEAEVTDPRISAIEKYSKNREYVTVMEVAENALDMEIQHINRSTQMQVSTMLKQLGWYKGNRQKINGVCIYPYYPSDETKASWVQADPKG